MEMSDNGFMRNEDLIETVRKKYRVLAPMLDERSRRVWAAAEAEALGYGGQSIVAAATGMSRTTINRELSRNKQAPVPQYGERLRAPGGGRKKVSAQEPTLLSALESLVEPTTRGDPESPLRWTCKSARQLAEALQAKGYSVGRQTIATLLEGLGYSLQGNRKTREGSWHPDRDAQFQYINERVQDFQRRGQPVASVDTKKKELVGDFKNGGQEWHLKGRPESVRVHDFVDKKLGKVNPYGVYDPTANIGWVSVGTDHDTAEFAVESVRRWWEKMGRACYPDASDKIEHRMFSHISMNWRGKPLISHEVIINLIAGTTTRTGLKIKAELDTNVYPPGLKVTDEELNKVRIERADFHGEWNYTIVPNDESCST